MILKERQGDNMALLEINNVSISYGDVTAVSGFSLSLGMGEICSIVGESGSGKTTVIRALLGLLPFGGKVTDGKILYEERDMLALNKKQQRELRGRDISIIFQDSGAMMNPIKTVGATFVEYIRSHESISKRDAFVKCKEMLTKMRLPDAERVMRSYPFQLSGGMRQRAGIAMAMTYKPKLLIADEPTSALDATTQAQIIREMSELRDKFGTSIIMVTHDLGVASYISDRIVVMRNGRIEENGDRDSILYSSKNEYTKMLLEAVPSLGGKRYV